MTHDRDASARPEDRVDAPFWKGLLSGELHIQRCRDCARWNWPADWRCPKCGSYVFEWPIVPARGHVYSWIRTHYPFVEAYADLIPYVNVLVELDGAEGCRLIGLLVGDSSTVAIGTTVEGTFELPSRRTADLPALRWSIAP
jgi:uncharacterized protein